MTEQWPMYRDMTAEQMLAWGRAEHAARMSDLRDRGEHGLAVAQQNAKSRRTEIGASTSQVDSMLRAVATERRQHDAAARKENSNG